MFHKVLCTPLFWSYKFYLSNVQVQVYSNSFWRHCMQCLWCRFCAHKWNFMPARRCNVIWKSWTFVRLHVCCKYKNNHLYKVSIEDVKWLSCLSVECYSSRESLLGKWLPHQDDIKKKTWHYHFQGARLKTSLDNNKKVVSKRGELFYVQGTL